MEDDTLHSTERANELPNSTRIGHAIAQSRGLTTISDATSNIHVKYLHIDVMGEEKTRVDFNAPVSLVEQADVVAVLLGVSRTQLLIEALRGEIEELATDDRFQRMISDAYYSGEISFETIESILGTESDADEMLAWVAES